MAGAQRMQPVDHAARRPARDGGGDACVVGAFAAQLGTEGGAGGRFRAEDEGRAQLRRTGAQAQRGRNAFAIHDAAGRDYGQGRDRKSTRLNSSHLVISYAVFCLKKKTTPLPPSSYQSLRLPPAYRALV